MLKKLRPKPRRNSNKELNSLKEKRSPKSRELKINRKRNIKENWPQSTKEFSRHSKTSVFKRRKQSKPNSLSRIRRRLKPRLSNRR